MGTRQAVVEKRIPTLRRFAGFSRNDRLFGNCISSWDRRRRCRSFDSAPCGRFAQDDTSWVCGVRVRLMIGVERWESGGVAPECDALFASSQFVGGCLFGGIAEGPLPLELEARSVFLDNGAEVRGSVYQVG